MRVFLHVGPHKTGTTFLQFALLEASRTGAGFHYPVPRDMGPGHARLAWQALGLHSPETERDLLVEVVEKAMSAGHDKLVFSAEDFSHAVNAKEKLLPLCRLAERFPLDLIATQSPLVQRLASVIQERIKHGASLEYWNATQTLQILSAEPCMRPDLLPILLTEVGAAHNHVIFVDRDRPDKLFAAMSRVLGEDIPLPRNAPRNARISFVHARLLSLVNEQLPDQRGAEARAIARAAFEAAAAKSPELMEIPYPAPPPELAALLDQFSEAQARFLDQFATTGRLTLHR